MPDPDVLIMWTIYKDPRDYPGQFVVRGHDITRRGPQAHPQPLLVASSLEEARHAIPNGCVCMDRDPADEPQIVETWF